MYIPFNVLSILEYHVFWNVVMPLAENSPILNFKIITILICLYDGRNMSMQNPVFTNPSFLVYRTTVFLVFLFVILNP